MWPWRSNGLQLETLKAQSGKQNQERIKVNRSNKQNNTHVAIAFLMKSPILLCTYGHPLEQSRAAEWHWETAIHVTNHLAHNVESTTLHRCRIISTYCKGDDPLLVLHLRPKFIIALVVLNLLLQSTDEVAIV